MCFPNCNKPARCLCLFMIGLSCMVHTSYAQSPAPDTLSWQLSHVPFETTGDPGLFNDALQDSAGYIWISSTKGLNAFDGRHLTAYSNRSKEYPMVPGAANENCGMLTAGSPGLLYLQGVTSNSVLCFDHGKRQVRYRLGSPGPPYGFLRGYSRPAGEEGALALYVDNEQAKVRMVAKEAGGADRLVYEGPCRMDAIITFRYAAGQHWMFNGRTALRIEPGTFRVHYYTLPAASKGVCELSADGRQIWFLDDDKKNIYQWSPSQDSIVPYYRMPHFITRFAVDRQGVIYGGYRDHCWIVDKHTGQTSDYSAPFGSLIRENELSGGLGQEIVKILVAADHSVYFIRQRAIYRFVPGNPAGLSFKQLVVLRAGELSNNSFRALTEDDEGTLYASYYTGIVQKKAGGDSSFHPFAATRAADSVMKNAWHLNWWNGCLLWNNAIIDLSTGQFTHLTPAFTNGHTTQLLRGDTLWFYNWRSPHLYCYDLRNKKLTYTPLDGALGLQSGGIIEEMNALIPDALGDRFWVAMKWDGIALIGHQGRLLKKYGPDQLKIEGDLGSTVNALCLRPDGLWFGCSDGLGLIDTASGKITIYKDPFLAAGGEARNRTVFSILEDSARHFYLGTDQGIVYFHTHTRQFYNLPPQHPLAAIEFNRASAFRSSDNTYYFGSTDGLFAFTPASLPFQNAARPVATPRIINAVIYNSNTGQERYAGAIPLSVPLLLGPSEKNMELHLSVPVYDHHLYYRYLLKGPVERQHDYSPESPIKLYDLLPGQYTLQVWAATTYSDYRAGTAILRFSIAIAWYKRPLVILLLATAFLLAIIGALQYRYRRRLARYRALAHLRTHISGDLHDEVGSTLTAISLQSQLLCHAPEAPDPNTLLHMSAMCNDAMERMRDIVWSIDSRKDRFRNLVDRMKAFAESILPGQNITCTFSLTNIDGDKFIDPHHRKNIYLVFKEAITNIAKHAGATQVTVGLTYSKKQLHLLIADNGQMPPVKATDGQGLDNMARRAEAMQGKLTTWYQHGFHCQLIVLL